MNKSIEFLKGKKTYGVAVVGGLYLFGCYLGWFEFDEKVCAGLGIGFVATFRSALSNLFPTGKLEVHEAELKTAEFLDYKRLAEELKGSGPRGATDPTSELTKPTPGGPGAAISLLLLIGLVGTLALPLVGCASLEKAALRPEVTIVTNTVERLVVQTNTIPIAVAVPGETIVKTNFVERLVTNEVQVIQTQTVTNYVVKPEIADAVQTAKTGAAVAGVFNPGAGAAATAGLGILSAGLAFLAARKNKDAKASGAQLTAVIKGVEDFTTGFDKDAGAKVKDAIAAASKELGVADSLHSTVKELTTAKI